MFGGNVALSNRANFNFSFNRTRGKATTLVYRQAIGDRTQRFPGARHLLRGVVDTSDYTRPIDGQRTGQN
jgi:hypothetical protein